MKAFAWIALQWSKVPPPLKAWLKGAEVAVVGAVTAACIGVPATDFTNKESIAKLAAGVGAAAYGAIRLYMAQSPIQNVLQQTASSEKLTAGGLTLEKKTTETISGPPETALVPGITQKAAALTPPAGLDG